jgi:hypothetical protein
MNNDLFVFGGVCNKAANGLSVQHNRHKEKSMGMRYCSIRSTYS